MSPQDRVFVTGAGPVGLVAAANLLRAGVPWEEVIGAASQVKADLIIMGTHGRRGLDRALLGSVAEKVVRMSTIPVLTVHAKSA